MEFADFNHGPMETPMTDTSMPLIELLQKQDDGDFLRAVAEAVLQLLMEHDVEGLVGAGRYERGDGRLTWRNGYRDRELKTRLGVLNLRVPKLRQGSYFPGFLEPRRTSEKALVAVVQGEPLSRHRFEADGERDRRRLNPPGRRAGAGDGAERDLQEHRLEALQG
jgi:putative transposase